MKRRVVLAMTILGLCVVLATGARFVVTQWGTQFPGTWTYDGAVSYANNSTEGGFTDWRLATRAEWQAAIAAGTVGPLAPNIPPNNYFWTADQQGQRAWIIKIATDANGNVIPSLSGSTMRVLKGSSVYAVAVR